MGIILPDTDAQVALFFAERIIDAVRELEILHQGNPHGIVTISIGIYAKVPRRIGITIRQLALSIWQITHYIKPRDKVRTASTVVNIIACLFSTK